jgi:hypothetical protein
MDSQKISDWVQIVTGVAVLVGLGLVVWELSQSRDVAYAQLSSDGTDQYLQHAVPKMGENPATALAKACNDPHSLSDEELVVLDAYFTVIVAVPLRAYNITRRSGLYEAQWENLVRVMFPLILRSIPGRTWWANEKAVYPPEIGTLVDSFAGSSPSNEECWIGDWRMRIRQASTP